MNKVILMGRLTKDPEIRYTQSAQPMAVTRYTLAVNRQFKREGEPDADFINIVAFGKRGEFASKYFKKGLMVGIVGRLQINTVDDGNGNRRWFTDVIVDEQHFAESKTSFESHSASNNQFNNPSVPAQNVNAPSQQPVNNNQNQAADGFYPINEDLDDDDLPF